MKFEINDYVSFTSKLSRSSGLGYVIRYSAYVRVMVLVINTKTRTSIRVGEEFPFDEDELQLANEKESILIGKMLTFK